MLVLIVHSSLLARHKILKRQFYYQMKVAKPASPKDYCALWECSGIFLKTTTKKVLTSASYIV